MAQSSAASAEGVICLAIEEPELFQHPIQAQTFAKVLRSLAQDPQKRIQVTYATHSPYFLAARDSDQIRRLTRSSGDIPTVTVHFANVEDVKDRLNGIVDPEVVDRRLDHNVADQLAIALFANRAFLSRADRVSCFFGIGDRGSTGAFEASGISIVAVGGKTSIPLAHAILQSIGVPTYALFDGDAGFEARARERNRSQGDVDRQRNNHAVENRSLLRYFGLPEADFPNAGITENVAIFDDHLEGYLATNWGEWLVACRDLEAETGVSFSKNQITYRAATLRAQGNVPAFLAQIMEKVSGL